jgi:GNAT superfamily N-acetyltransferase
MPENHRVIDLGPTDAGEVLTLQRAAFIVEAQRYGDPNIQPLTETLDEVRRELNGHAIGIRINGRLVGSVRWDTEGDTTTILKLIVAPDMQAQGIGAALLRSAEQLSGSHHFVVLTGGRSERNLRFYANAGYVVNGHEHAGDDVELAHLDKDLAATDTGAPRDHRRIS